MLTYIVDRKIVIPKLQNRSFTQANCAQKQKMNNHMKIAFFIISLSLVS